MFDIIFINKLEETVYVYTHNNNNCDIYTYTQIKPVDRYDIIAGNCLLMTTHKLVMY